MTPLRTELRTQVAIVGAGPAGLMLSHLLHRAGIATIVIESRSRTDIEQTGRAGILEADSVRLLTDTGVSDRVLRDGHEHHGIYLRYNGESHYVNFKERVGQSVWLYPQTEVFIDLADRRLADGGDVRFSVTDTEINDPLDGPTLCFTDSAGARFEVHCDLLVGADGSHSVCRGSIPERQRQSWSRDYPFAWFGIICEAPPSAPELIYTNSERGFALISQRTPTLQRMYFQCDPSDDPDHWTEEQIWAEFRSRVNGNGFELQEGKIIEKSVLGFRSFVGAPMRYGRLLLAGDAAHTVPPTGAKGLNLALADVRVLAEVIEDSLGNGSQKVLDEYSTRALQRVWKAQHFSYWMTSMLHNLPGGNDFDRMRQLGELAMVTGSEYGSAYLAEAYTGWSRDAR